VLPQASARGTRLAIWPVMIIRWISLVPSQMRSTRLVLEIKTAASTVWEILHRRRIDPAPRPHHCPL
jgi:hypothetical protein